MSPSGMLDEEALGSAAAANVFGVRCYAGTLEGAVTGVIERARSRLGGYAVLCNVHVLMTAQDEVAVHKAVDDAWLVLPDGAPVAWLERRLGVREAERIGGPDLMLGVLDRGRASGLRHVLVGSTEPTLDRLEERIRSRLRGVQLVGSLAPPFGDPSEWSEEAIGRIRAWEPDIVWLALGAPKQELWMRHYAERLAPAFVLGVGAAFDFHAENKARAPGWMQGAGLEWVHRLASEPTRLMGRYLRTNSAFVLKVLAGAVRRDIRFRVDPQREGNG